jgi:hypothetical protein
MSQTDTIIDELRAMQAGVDRAQSTAAAADSEAEKVAVRAAAAGFSAIAVSMSQVREAIKEVLARLGSVNGSVNEASTSVTAVPKEASPAQVISALTRAVEKVNAAHEGITACIGRVDETKTLTMRVLQGGDPGPMLSMLDSIKEILVLVTQRGGTARQSLTTTVSEAGQMGNSGN